MSQRGAAPLAEAGTVRDPGRFARATAHGAGIAGRVGALAAGAVRQADVAGGTGALADAIGTGQLGGAQDAGVRPVAVHARDHAGLHSRGWLVAEHGREHPAGVEAAGVGRPAPDGFSRRSLPGSRQWRGTGTATRRPSSGAASAQPDGSASASVATASAVQGHKRGGRSRENSNRVMATLKANDPLEQETKPGAPLEFGERRGVSPPVDATPAG